MHEQQIIESSLGVHVYHNSFQMFYFILVALLLLAVPAKIFDVLIRGYDNDIHNSAEKRAQKFHPVDEIEIQEINKYA